MAYSYVFIDGERVEVNVAREFENWRRDFKAETGCDLYVSSGVRTADEQQRGYNDYLAGRTNGVKWAKPDESSHCEIGPAGPRALDIRDSGSDAGVTVKGTYRWNVAVRLGRKYGFTWGGWGVPDNEGWHFENHVVIIGAPASAAGAGAGSSSIPSTKSEEDEEMLMLKITAGKSMHYCALGIGVFKHFVGAEPYERVMKISRARDDWQTIDIAELPTFLATYGCDKNIWDFRNKAGKSVSYVDPGAQFVVLDPLTKKVASGNTWSAQAAIRAAA